MMTLRRAADRGHADHGWLNSHHTFSFADFYDPKQMGFRALRVINDDTVAAGQGFGTHPHQDMEILSYVLEGELAHKDSMGTGSVIRPGDVQRMSAGTGVRHSEFNASKTNSVHFLQIWVLPGQKGLEPSYEQKHFAPDTRRGQLKLVASPDAAEGSLTLHQDAKLYAGLFDAGEQQQVKLAPGRHAWVHVAKGSVKVNGASLSAGDGAAFSDEAQVQLEGVSGGAEVLLFDLA
jgi:redox-sensitive bicupin YhaK (pirin superfamily)